MPIRKQPLSILSLFLSVCSLCLIGVSLAGAQESSADNAPRAAYLRELEPWIGAAATQLRRVGDDMMVFGLGQSGHWYMQAHDTAFCA
ncbi:MAG: hypothetical protein IJG02_06680, partial [Thermoguttaceae bacterium]|nr:hypothetical protein [Thermoguttaceae bacterium]